MNVAEQQDFEARLKLFLSALSRLTEQHGMELKAYDDGIFALDHRDPEQSRDVTESGVLQFRGKTYRRRYIADSDGDHIAFTSAWWQIYMATGGDAHWRPFYVAQSDQQGWVGVDHVENFARNALRPEIKKVE